MTEWLSEQLNSLHLWLCAQPTDFDSKAVLNQDLTPAQDEERNELAELAYFGWRSEGTGFRTLDWNLPLLDRWEQVIPRRITLAMTGPPP